MPEDPLAQVVRTKSRSKRPSGASTRSNKSGLWYGISAIPIAPVHDELKKGQLVGIKTQHTIDPLTVYCCHISSQRDQLAREVLAMAEVAAKEFIDKHKSGVTFVPRPEAV